MCQEMHFHCLLSKRSSAIGYMINTMEVLRNVDRLVKSVCQCVTLRSCTTQISYTSSRLLVIDCVKT